MDDAANAAAPDATPAAAPPSKRARKRAREDAATAVQEAELSRLNDAAPKSADDFERLVLGSPSSSYVWIRYMAFLLSMAEVAKARAVAERALETIDYRCADIAALQAAQAALLQCCARCALRSRKLEASHTRALGCIHVAPLGRSAIGKHADSANQTTRLKLALSLSCMH